MKFNEYHVVTLNGTVIVHGGSVIVVDGVLEILNGGKTVALFKHWEHLTVGGAA